MDINQLVVGNIQTNCYIIKTNNNGAIVIDAGASPEAILGFLQKNNLKLKALLFTHGHFDHVSAINRLKDETDALIYIHQDDEELLLDPKKSFGSFYGMFPSFNPVKPDVLFKDDDVIEIDDIKLKVMHTPGHTKGSSIFICDDYIISGDTLFCGSIGRTDLYGGSMQTILQSLKKIACIKGEYIVLPGHGERTTLSYEKNTNPYLQ